MDIRDDEKKMLIEDHEYDGIKELSNNPPPWIMWVFYITVIWSVFYFEYYTVFKMGNQESEYKDEVSSFSRMAPAKSSIDENKIALLTSEADLESGKKLFAEKTCITCHGPEGGGNAVGPNLTDNAWLHGNTPKDVFKLIKYGFAAKGMLSFKDQLTDKQILQLTSYILIKLKGANPKNGKAPQGTVYQ